MLRVTLFIAFATLALAGCVHAGDEERPDSGEARTVSSGTLAVGRGTIRAPYVAGAELSGVPSNDETPTLVGEANPTFVGSLSPAAVAGSGGRVIAYNSFARGRPVVRVYDARSRSDAILDEGAYSIAWRRDGAIAYFKGLRPVVRDPRRYLGHVVVRAARGARPVRWTRKPGRYVVAAWAGRRLLVYRLRQSFPHLLVLDAPGRLRMLAPLGALVALSPDGRTALLARYGAARPFVRVVDVASGKELARYTFSKEAGVRWVSESGSWRGDVAVAPVTYGFAVFRVRRERITLEQVLKLDAGTFPIGASEPRFTRSARSFVAWAELQSRPRQAVPQAVVIECDRIARRCRRGRETSSFPGPRPIFNPSRP